MHSRIFTPFPHLHCQQLDRYNLQDFLCKNTTVSSANWCNREKLTMQPRLDPTDYL